MSKFYKIIDCHNFSEIQEEVYNVFPKYLHNIHTLYYPKNNHDLFFGLPKLYTFLESLGFVDRNSVLNFGFNVMKPKLNIGVHMDSPKFRYSLNLPIKGYEKSMVSFYKTLPGVQPNARGYRTPNSTNPNNTDVIYYTYNKEDVTLLETNNVTGPHILDTDVPHDVLNDSDQERITLLIKLSNNVNDLVQKYTGLKSDNH